MKATEVPGTVLHPDAQHLNPRPLKICFLARSLDYGGAERQLIALASGLRNLGHQVTVVLFYGGGALEPELLKRGVKVILIGKTGRWDVVIFLWRLVAVLRRLRPDVCHAYLTVPNIISGMLRPLLHGAQLVWGVRASDMDLRRYDRLSRLVGRLEPIISRSADLIIVNSESGREHAAARGFPYKRLRTVPNGVDLTVFRPERPRGLDLRRKWGAVEDERFIGLVGRLDPMKDHDTFLAATESFMKSGGGARFICIGSGPGDYLRELQREAERRGVSQQIVWSGAQADMPAVYNALDLVTLTSSFGEGFPNVLGEAMACGVICVATDVGDTGRILGDSGILVPARDPEALATAWRNALSMLNEEGETIGKRARTHIADNFGVETMIKRSEAFLVDLCR